MQEEFSFLNSVKSTVNAVKKFLGGEPKKQETKKSTGFMDKDFMEAYSELSVGGDNYFEKYKISSAKSLSRIPSTQVNLPAGGSSFNFRNPQLQTALRKFVRNTNNREMLQAMKRANYTPQAVKPMSPNIKTSATKYG